MPSADDLTVEDVTPAWGLRVGAVGLLGGFRLGFWLRSADHLRGHLYGLLRGIRDAGQGFGAGVLHRLDRIVCGLGRSLDDRCGQLLGILDDAGALIVSLEGCGVGSLVGFVGNVGLEVILQARGKGVQLSSYLKAIAEIAQGAIRVLHQRPVSSIGGRHSTGILTRARVSGGTYLPHHGRYIHWNAVGFTTSSWTVVGRRLVFMCDDKLLLAVEVAEPHGAARAEVGVAGVGVLVGPAVGI